MEQLPGGRQSGSQYLQRTGKHLAKPPRFPFRNAFTLLNRTTLEFFLRTNIPASTVEGCRAPTARRWRLSVSVRGSVTLGRRDDSCGGSVPLRRTRVTSSLTTDNSRGWLSAQPESSRPGESPADKHFVFKTISVSFRESRVCGEILPNMLISKKGGGRGYPALGPICPDLGVTGAGTGGKRRSTLKSESRLADRDARSNRAMVGVVLCGLWPQPCRQKLQCHHVKGWETTS